VAAAVGVDGQMRPLVSAWRCKSRSTKSALHAVSFSSHSTLTLWRPLLPCGYRTAMKHPVPDRV